FFSSRRRHTRFSRDWSSDVCSSDLVVTQTSWAPKRKQPLRAVDLKEMRWVFRERGSATRSIFEDALTALGLDPATLDIVLELPRSEERRVGKEGRSRAVPVQ